jgi:AAA domain
MHERPYTGLMPFSERQAPFFFGRDGERELVIANMLASPLTVLYGPSGVGKSSLLNAGVAAHLRRIAQQNLEERGTPEFKVVVFGSWRDDPASELARALGGPTGERTSATLAKQLATVSERLDSDLLIILDQFEEYFLYHPNKSGNGIFDSEFAEAVNQTGLRASFLVSIREDSLAKLDRFEASIPNIFDHRLRIDHLELDPAREAIRRPLEKFNGLESYRGESVTIEDDLVEDVVEQVRISRVVTGDSGHGMVARALRSDSGSPRVETPYLQLVMTRLWDEERRAGSRVLRAKTLRRLGGAEEIVSTHLDAAMSTLTATETEAAAKVFNHLVTPSRTKIAHSVPDLANYAGISCEAIIPLLQKLSTGQNRILTPIAPAPDQPAHLRYQILHDVLAASILEWRTGYVQRRERAEAQAQADEQRKRADQEAKARARLRKLSILPVAMAIVASGFAWVAASQTRKAEERRLQAEAAQLEAVAAKHTAEAGRLELEAANKARSAAERLAELNRLEADAARAELRGTLAFARNLREQAAEKKVQVASDQAALVNLNQEVQRERRSAANTQTEVDRLRASGPGIDKMGIDSALQKYRAAYRSLDNDALVAIYPRVPNDRRKHLRQSRDSCLRYDVVVSVFRLLPRASDTVTAEAQTSYQCVPKAGNPLAATVMREDFWLRKGSGGSWIIDNITAPQ